MARARAENGVGRRRREISSAYSEETLRSAAGQYLPGSIEEVQSHALLAKPLGGLFRNDHRDVRERTSFQHRGNNGLCRLPEMAFLLIGG